MNELSIIKYISKLKSAQVGGNIFFQKSCADNKTRGSYGIGDDCADNKTKGSYGIGDDCADNKTRGSYGIGDDCADNKTRGSYGIGDDCAVIPFSKQESILVTTDSLIENVHFNLEWISLYELGCKSVLVNISDILSCGGVPEYLFLSINVPKRLNKLEKLFNGIDFVCRKYGIKILGGDTTSSKNDLCITVTLMGKVKNENILYRHFSRPGELICVTGFVGLSGTGFYVLKDKLNKNQYKESVRHHLVPGILSLKDAKILSENAGSSMDNSDGLYSSLWYMLEKNNNGCIINFSDIPIHDETKKIVETGKYEIEKLINFGEDYNCIFTGYSGNIEKIENTIKSKITVIGEITDDGKKIVIKNGKKILLKREGFIHNE